MVDASRVVGVYELKVLLREFGRIQLCKEGRRSFSNFLAIVKTSVDRMVDFGVVIDDPNRLSSFSEESIQQIDE